jgi:outer membrane protein TolC
MLLSGCAGRSAMNGSLATSEAPVASPEEGSLLMDAPDFGDVLNLDRLRAFALDNNPGLKSARSDWAAAQDRVSQAVAFPDPRLSYGYFIEPVETRTGPQEQKVGLSQTLPWFGKRSLRESIAIQDAEALRQGYLQKRLSVIRDLEVAYFEYAYLASAMQVNREHIELLGLIEGVASARFRTGDLSQSALIQIQVEQGKLEDRMRELESLRIPLSARIKAALGVRNDDNLLPWPESVDDAQAEVDVSELQDQLQENSPVLRRLRIMIERQEYAVQLAEKGYYPDFSVGVELTDIEGGDNPAMASVSMNLPVWRKSLRDAREEALNRRRSVEETLADQENSLSAQLDLQCHYLQDAERKLSLYRNTLIPKAQQAIDVAVKGFEGGRVRFAELLEAERTLLEFRLTVARQQVEYSISKAKIDELLGDAHGADVP